jgi:hypothetical protein
MFKILRTCVKKGYVQTSGSTHWIKAHHIKQPLQSERSQREEGNPTISVVLVYDLQQAVMMKCSEQANTPRQGGETPLGHSCLTTDSAGTATAKSQVAGTARKQSIKCTDSLFCAVYSWESSLNLPANVLFICLCMLLF